MKPEQRTQWNEVGKRPILFEIKNFTSKAELFEFIQQPDYRSPTMGGVCFAVVVDELPDNKGFNIEILLNDQTAERRWTGIPSQLVLPYDSYISKPDLSNFQMYTSRGYTKLHNWLANAVLRKHFPNENNGKLATISNLIIPMQGADFVQNDFQRILGFLSFFIFLIYIVPLYRLTYRIVNEKENRSRESMKMMGLTDTSYWLSWFTYYAILVTIISIIITALIGRLIKTSKTLMFVILWVYGYSLFGFTLIMQSLFNKARTAGGVSTTIYFVSIFID